MTVAHESGLQWLQSLARFGVRPGLSRTRRVLAYLGNPESKLRFYHVAGTNGKGSVCAYLHALLSTHERVGLFTSPAFDGFRARFRIGDESIAEDEFLSLAATVSAAAKHTVADDPLTEFEALTVMALLYFHRHHVDSVVWETGLGGRYDSTNVVSPIVTAITNVGLDHMEILGDTHRLIAADKAGIIKKDVPVITGANDAALWEILRQASERPAPAAVYGRQFAATLERLDVSSERMSYRGIHRDIHGVELPLLGAHQCSNAAIALAMMETADSLCQTDRLSDDEVRRAIKKTRWPGRFEPLLVGETRVILDGAHNVDGARALAGLLRDYQKLIHTEDGWTMVIGVLADKDAGAMLQLLLPLATRVIAVSPPSPRAMPAEKLRDAVRSIKCDIPVLAAPTVARGMEIAQDENHGEGICCWGSLYTVDAARQQLQSLAKLDYGTTG